MTEGKTKTQEKEYEFTLILAEPVELTEQVVDALFVAGCDDATVVSYGERLFLFFCSGGDVAGGSDPECHRRRA